MQVETALEPVGHRVAFGEHPVGRHDAHPLERAEHDVVAKSGVAADEGLVGRACCAAAPATRGRRRGRRRGRPRPPPAACRSAPRGSRGNRPGRRARAAHGCRSARRRRDTDAASVATSARRSEPSPCRPRRRTASGGRDRPRPDRARWRRNRRPHWSPSRITGTVFETPPSTSGTSVKGVGTLWKSSPLWASDIAVFQQCGLKGRVGVVPTRS